MVSPSSRARCRCVLLAAFSVFCGMGLHAQTVAVAEVDGYVTDPSGQSVPGAQVRMVETNKDVSHSAVTDTNGRYALPNLPVGPYRLEVTAQGFKKYTQTGIVLEVETNPQVNVALQLGSVTETVEVVASAAMVETKENSISQVIDQQKIDDLPLNGRNPTQLLTLTGASTSHMSLGGDLTGSKNMGGSNGSGQFSVAGGQANGVNYLLDGGDNNDAFSNVNLPIPFPDALQEFSVQTNGLPAQYGLHPGGVVNIVTKSGTNSIHGDAFEFLRNGDLDARQAGTPARDTLKQNQFGGTVGGPIKKDKLFFFGGYQGTQIRSNPPSKISFVPTQAALNGDFSVLDAAKSAGGCLNKSVALTDATTKNPYPNNRIPASQFDPAAVKLLNKYVPVSSNPCGEYQYGIPANNPDNQWVGRVDYVLSDKQTLFARAYVYDFTAQSVFDGSNALTTTSAGNHERSQTYTIGDTYVISPAAVNSFHASFDRRRDNRGLPSNVFSPKDLGINMYDAVPNFFQLSVNNYFSIGCGTCALAYFNVNTYQLSDDFTLMRGRHQMQFGVDARRDQFNSTNNYVDNGSFTFNGSITGDPLADLLTGRIYQFADSNPLSDYLRQTVLGIYAQDAFHATSHLTINFGLRWEPYTPAYDRYGRGGQFNQTLFNQNWHSSVYPNAPAGLVFAGDSVNKYGKAFTQSDWMASSPRFGLVWDPKGDGKQTIRTSFSLMHDTPELFYPERWTTNPPYASAITLTNPGSTLSNPWSTYPGGNPFPGAALFPIDGTYVTIPPNVKPTYEMLWNLSYQRQISTNWMVSANYLGNVTRHIWGAQDINPGVYIPGSKASVDQRRLLYLQNPALGQYYSSITQTDDGANAQYNGLLLSVNRRFSNHFSALANYTWSHCISNFDFTGELAGPVYQNSFNRNEGERSACAFDERHIFNLSGVALTGGLGGGLLNTMTKNWQFSPIVSLISGVPLTLTDGGKDISGTGDGNDRPNMVLPYSPYPAQQALNEWFNPAAFAIQPAGTFGNLGRLALRAPGTVSFDMSIARRFPFHERYNLEARGDFFNIMNHANWGSPTTSITSGTFGQILSFGSPRIIQVAMKLYF